MPAANKFLSYTYIEIKCYGLGSWSLSEESQSPDSTNVSKLTKDNAKHCQNEDMIRVKEPLRSFGSYKVDKLEQIN